MTVLDTSVVVDFLLGLSPRLELGRILTESHGLAFPHLLEVEAVSVFRRMAQKRQLSEERAAGAIEDLALFPALRYGHTELLPRMFALRSNFTAYDAAFLALAEAVDGTLLTLDTALRAYRGSARVEVIGR